VKTSVSQKRKKLLRTTNHEQDVFEPVEGEFSFINFCITPLPNTPPKHSSRLAFL
jgi:hypothetical protein